MRQRRWINMLLLVCLLAGLLPTTAFAEENVKMQANQPELTVNQSVVAFGGHEWYVIGYDGNGVYSEKGDKKVTLLAKNQDTAWSESIPFRKAYGGEFEDSQQYMGWYYAANPSGMENWETPNEYAGSTLQQKMEGIAVGFPELAIEEDLIEVRDFTEADDIKGQELKRQKVWALSKSEVESIGQSVPSYNSTWWLRSRGPASALSDTASWYCDGDAVIGMLVEEARAVRPAFA